MKVLVSFEVNMFGAFYATGFALLILAAARLWGVQINFMLHQAVEDFSLLQKNKFLAGWQNVFKDIFYWLVKLASP